MEEALAGGSFCIAIIDGALSLEAVSLGVDALFEIVLFLNVTGFWVGDAEPTVLKFRVDEVAEVWVVIFFSEEAAGFASGLVAEVLASVLVVCEFCGFLIDHS